jgi:chemosensory pili system protein ChpA (sensor histidine kinase/response regulator)
MLRDILFLLARAGGGSKLADEARALYRLAGTVPEDFETPRYGAVDTVALRAAREAVAAAALAWEKASRGGPADLPAFLLAVQGLDTAFGRLPWPGLRRLCGALLGLRRALPADGPTLAGALSLEVATALLFAGQALDRGARGVSQHERRAAEMADRIEAACERRPRGDEAMPAWLSELSRAAQERLTAAALVGELQTNLRACETVLDAFFRDPAQRSGLSGLQPLLGQVGGALRLLGHAEAAERVGAVLGQVAAFAADPGPPAAQACERVAEGLGALGFFVESLRRADRRGGSGSGEDPDSSGVRAGEPAVAPAVADATILPDRAVAFDATAPSESADEPAPVAGLDDAERSLEQLLAERRAGVPARLDALARRPGDPVARAALRDALFTVRDEAMLLDDAELRGHASDALARLDAGAAPDDAALAAAVARVAGDTAVAASTVAVVPTDAAAVDEELLGIFLDEADEVLAAISAGRAASVAAPADEALLTTIRRGFHTLKGSSRMVGLAPFGEAAWGFEQVLNALLADGRPGGAALYQGIAEACATMAGWVAGLREEPALRIDPSRLVALALALREGRPWPAADPGPSFPAPIGAGDDVIALTEVLDPLDLEVPVLSPLDEIEPMLIGGPAGPDALGLVAASATDVGLPCELPAPIADRTIDGTLHRIFLDEADQLLRVLDATLARWRADPDSPVDEPPLRAAHSLGGSARIVGLDAVHGAADALERFMLGRSVSPGPLQPADLDDIGFVLDRVRASVRRFTAGEDADPEPAMGTRAEALAERWSPAMDVDAQPALLASLAAAAPPAPPASAAAAAAAASVVPAGSLAAPGTRAAPLAPRPAVTVSATAGGEAPEGLAALVDEIDPELAPAFVEEADELLPRVGDGLRAWQQRPEDASGAAPLMRLLHTVKGSARMAGAMRLGQLVHDMETRIEAASALPRVPAALLDDLIARHDQVLTLHEAIREPRSEPAQAAARAVVEALSGARSPDGGDAPVAAGVPAAAEPHGASAHPAAPGTSPSLIRVRADLLDRLVNQAGEVSIARARLENELGGIRQSLGELSENVSRLRSQLREIELAADARIQTRDARSGEPDAELDPLEFDPLELDRYTRFQELTRLLAESVSDVATVQQNGLRNLDDAQRDLARQSQVTRDLQQDLMRIRMVRFGSIADRLYRVVRQAAKELDKRVHLDLRGAAAELDRGVLERMAGPIEHLLRNAVAHGIEPRAERAAAGKSETGEITLDVRQEGNEVVLTFSDDGAGLDYRRIQARALERGLIAPDARPSPSELGNLIFMPGFTTASAVTALAGRGVGMDVVRAEVAAMGGRIDLESEPGRGTRFAVHLPVSLAVAQVVLLTVGAVRIAVASALIEQVLQLKPEALASAYAAHRVDWQGQPVPLYFLGSLLELPGCTPRAQRYSQVVVVRSGSTRIALHVDHVAPSQEVVVKHVGPQLARLTGMAGATVLGNGEIVLILNPVQIAASGRRAQAGEGDTATFAPMRIEIAPTVMVVDDSVTVRKVTQRLLAREGYPVMLAKDGLDALRQLQDAVPDLMLLDIEMPRMDGFELTKTLRADARFRHLPIVMITSRTADKHRDRALALGVDVFLGKPYDEAELLGHVRALAARRATRTD